MAAITPSTVLRESFGSLTAHIATFAATADTGDTWASGIPGIVAVVASQADAPGTQGSTGAGASYSGSTITLHIGEDNSAVQLIVLSKS